MCTAGGRVGASCQVSGVIRVAISIRTPVEWGPKGDDANENRRGWLQVLQRPRGMRLDGRLPCSWRGSSLARGSAAGPDRRSRKLHASTGCSARRLFLRGALPIPVSHARLAAQVWSVGVARPAASLPQVGRTSILQRYAGHALCAGPAEPPRKYIPGFLQARGIAPEDSRMVMTLHVWSFACFVELSLGTV